MSEIEHTSSGIFSDANDEQNDEFEIIHQADDQHDDEEDQQDPANNKYQIKSSAFETAASSCKDDGTTSVASDIVADVGDGLDGGKSMYSSVSAAPSQNLLDSVYSFPPFATNTANMEKLVSLLHDEQNKNHTMLERIMQMLADLSKERSDNTDLRTQNQALKSMLQQENSKNATLEAEVDSVKKQLSASTIKIVDHEAQIGELVRFADDLSERVDVLINEKAALEARLMGVSGAHAAGDAALQEARDLLAVRESELATKTEIINVLQVEENAEIVKLVDANRQNYRRNLDVLEARMAELHENGEFP